LKPAEGLLAALRHLMNPKRGCVLPGSGLRQYQDWYISLRQFANDSFHRPHAGAHTFDKGEAGGLVRSRPTDIHRTIG
jgi:hypothetical protein